MKRQISSRMRRLRFPKEADPCIRESICWICASSQRRASNFSSQYVVEDIAWKRDKTEVKGEVKVSKRVANCAQLFVAS